ncbi:hypothetical protein MPSEU_000003000 [Mayamaea pseudoterrestris]|nr:hypothetical protein MPSEU_000003000 [Mayamaea pseudoterrestris]
MSKEPSAAASAVVAWTNDLQADFEQIVRVGEECISEHEVKALLTKKQANATQVEAAAAATTPSSSCPIILYDGFEPSGRMHIAQGVFKAMNVNRLTSLHTCDARFVFWVADWFALMNDKMGGSLEKIQTVGHYLIQVWKAAGMNLAKVDFKWASIEITQHANIYWPMMLDIARRFNVTRIKKCCQIMGRLEGTLSAAQVLYPLMQCTDVFFLKADVCQLGVDQRKVNMLAREYCEAAGRKVKPIILSHHMLYGLKAGQEKMSKSDPNSAVFMEDSADDVERKILSAYCPSRLETLEGVERDTTVTDTTDHNDVEDAGKASMHLTVDNLKNPCLDYIHHIIFSAPNATFTADEIVYKDYASVEAAFLSGDMSEDSLKRGLIDALNHLLEPVRSHFINDPEAKRLLECVQQYKKDSVTTVTEQQTVRRLDLVKLGKVAPDSHLVFAPLPTASPSLQDSVHLIALLKHGTESENGNDTANTPDSQTPIILFLSDWSARVCNACQADVKAITAYYTILLASLKALDAGLMSRVQVVWQSEAILADPSNYWISVINVGRHFSLNKVMGAQMQDSECVGLVIARLMRVADVVGIAPKILVMLDHDADSIVVTELVEDFYNDKLAKELTLPVVALTMGAIIRLQAERESEALVLENDEYYILDDPKVHGKSKLKKAFCEPGNISFCPPIQLSSVFAINGAAKQLVVSRSPDNGGDVVYQNVQALESDFCSGALHPGDLKASVATVMVAVLEQLSTELKQADAAKAAKDLKAYQKKAAKSKK